MRDDWPKRAIGSFAKESRVPGSTGARARKITVKLYGRGAVAKDEATPGSASTRYYQRRRGQLIYSKLDFLNGAFAVVPSELDGFESTLDLPAFDLGEEVCAVWLRRIVSQPRFYKSFGGEAKGSRKARRVNPEEFLSREIPLPPLDEQRKIAAILSSVDETIEKTEAVIAQLDVVKKAMLEELLTRGIPGRHPRFKQTEIGEVPASWSVVRLDDVCERMFVGIAQAATHAYVSRGGVPLIRTTNVKANRILVDDLLQINVEFAKAMDSKHLKAGDVLSARTGNPGVSAVVPRELEGAQCFTLLVARVGPDLEPALLAQLMNSGIGAKIVQSGEAGGAQKNLNVTVFREALIAVPPIAEQREILLALDCIDQRRWAEEAFAAGLLHLRDSLSAALLCGDLRVLS